MSQSQYLSKSHYITDFLTPEFNQTLLDSLLTDADTFRDAKVFSSDATKGVVDSQSRLAKVTDLRSDLRKQFTHEVRAILPEVCPKVGLKMQDGFQYELSAAVHHDGGFFTRHIDTRVAANAGTNRYLSAVYYMSRTPQQFTGGQFRLHSIVGDGFQDFEATNNALLIFPSFAPHEVLPISVPSGRVEDCRFSINFWVHVPA